MMAIDKNKNELGVCNNLSPQGFTISLIVVIPCSRRVQRNKCSLCKYNPGYFVRVDIIIFSEPLAVLKSR